MTVVVQSVHNQPINGVGSWSFTLSSTGAGNLLVVQAGVQQFGGTNPTSFVVTDNGSGNTWATAVFKAGTGGDRFSVINYCLSTVAGVTSVTVTPNTGTFYGSSGAEEVSGGTWALDQTGSAVASLGGTITLSCSAVDVGTTNFVAAAVQIGGGGSPSGISDPPTGYTSSSVEQDDNTFAGSETCYRINTSAVTDSVTWTSASGATGFPAAIASFKVSGGGGGVTVALTGQSASFGLGTLTPALLKALTGTSIASASGLDTPVVSKALIGIGIATSSGILLPSIVAAIVGSSAAFGPGTVTPNSGGPVTAVLTGSSASFVAGNLVPGLQISLSGNLITMGPGAVSPATSVALVGIPVGASSGALAPSSTIGLVGLNAVFGSGSLTPTVSLGLTGIGVGATPGSGSPTDTAALLGQNINFFTGILVASGGIPVAGTTVPIVGFVNNTGYLSIRQ